LLDIVYEAIPFISFEVTLRNVTAPSVLGTCKLGAEHFCNSLLRLSNPLLLLSIIVDRVNEIEVYRDDKLELVMLIIHNCCVI